MAGVYEPHLGRWYEDEAGHLFQVLDIDPRERSVEIQYQDGSLEELDMAAWHEMGLMPRPEPQDDLGLADDPFAMGGMAAGIEDDDIFLSEELGEFAVDTLE